MDVAISCARTRLLQPFFVQQLYIATSHLMNCFRISKWSLLLISAEVSWIFKWRMIQCKNTKSYCDTGTAHSCNFEPRIQLNRTFRHLLHQPEQRWEPRNSWWRTRHDLIRGRCKELDHCARSRRRFHHPLSHALYKSEERRVKAIICTQWYR